MGGDVIKSFLVGLGFDVDESTLSKFNDSITSASTRVAALGTAITAAATTVGYGITRVSEDFEQMGYEYRLIVPAVNKALLLRQQLLAAYSAAGVNITKVILNSVKLNYSLDKTKFAFKAIYDSVASRFFPLITKNLDNFRKNLYANMPHIQDVLERMITFLFRAFNAVAELGARLWSILGRVYDFFVSLDRATDGWSTAILGMVAAWRLLNLSFLATPIGMVIAGLVALLALYDDFETFKEGGKSLFDWGPVIPFINGVNDILDDFVQTWKSAIEVVHQFQEVLSGLFALSFPEWLSSLKDLGASIGTLIMGTSTPQAVAANAGAAGALGAGGSAPLGARPNGGSNQTNQNVTQQTNINVVGTADPHATASAVAGQQARVNYDHVNNLKGSTR